MDPKLSNRTAPEAERPSNSLIGDRALGWLDLARSEPTEPDVTEPGAGLTDGTRWAAYVRDNSASRARRDRQVRSIQDVARAHGRTIALDAVFVDIASGLDAIRPGLDCLRAAVAAGTYDTVVIYDWSKLSRSPHELWRLLDEFGSHGVRVLCPGAPALAESRG